MNWRTTAETVARTRLQWRVLGVSSPVIPLQRRHPRGSALLAVLWVIAFLGFLIITTMMITMQDVETVSSRQLVFRARQLAEMGVALGAHPGIKADDQLLHRRLNNESCEVNITSEEGRLNLNAMLTEERRPVLERLFVSWGLSQIDAESVIDALMDWVDDDDLKRLKGAEKKDYADAGLKDRPFNRPFSSLDEVLLVRGMEAVAELNPRWRESLTLWGQGALDINEAAPDLIAVVAESPIHLAESMVSARNGRDGIPHTEDDEPVQSIEEAMTLLGVNPQNAPALAGIFTLHGSTVRVESIGTVGDYSRGIAVVLQKTGGQGGIMEWREFVPR
jgi:type II secretory pathway component PulK